MYKRIRAHTLVSADRCWILYTLALQALAFRGEFWECGVYKGGTAALLAGVLASARGSGTTPLRLFDTFSGMPETDPERDRHRSGDFADTSVDSVKGIVKGQGSVEYHVGVIPNTFAGLESARIVLAHIDVDIYQSVLDCARFIYPRLVAGGFMIFDDYGFPTCPGARAAVDEYFQATAERPLVLPTGQAIVFKSSGI